VVRGFIKFYFPIWLVVLVTSCDLLNHDSTQDFSEFPVGVNYYPRGKIWRDFWSRYDKQEIALDFERLEKMDVDLVRVFLFQDVFLNDSTRGSALNNFDHLVTTAEKHNLRLIVTSFDWAKPYKYDLNVSKKDSPFNRGLFQIVQKYRLRPGIYAWDFKNEPDHDFDSDGKEVVLDWLAQAASVVQVKFPSILSTVGWLHLGQEQTVNDQLSFLSFHQFPEQAQLGSRIKEFKEIFPAKKIMLEEVGYSTKKPSQDDRANLKEEERQSFFISNAIYSSVAYQLAGLLVWNLYDHPEGVGPLRPENENYFGILKVDGSAKLAASMLNSGVYPNNCGGNVSSNEISGFCVSAWGSGSKIDTFFSGPSSLKFSAGSFKLDRGYNCFCYKPLASKLLNAFGFSLKIQHQGLASINGRKAIPPGEWLFR